VVRLVYFGVGVKPGVVRVEDERGVAKRLPDADEQRLARMVRLDRRLGIELVHWLDTDYRASNSFHNWCRDGRNVPVVLSDRTCGADGPVSARRD
jgi:hypothetical protein